METANQTGSKGKVTVTSFKPCESGTLTGFADIVIDAWTLEIRGMGIHERDGKRWVSMPSTSYQTKDGKRKYSPVMEFQDKAKYHRFSKSVLDALDQYLAR